MDALTLTEKETLLKKLADNLLDAQTILKTLEEDLDVAAGKWGLSATDQRDLFNRLGDISASTKYQSSSSRSQDAPQPLSSHLNPRT